jgi:hypothetical protein
MVFIVTRCHSCVTMRVSSRLLIITVYRGAIHRSLLCAPYHVPAHGGGSIVFQDTSEVYFAHTVETWFPVAEGQKNKKEQ